MGLEAQLSHDLRNRLRAKIPFYISAHKSFIAQLGSVNITQDFLSGKGRHHGGFRLCSSDRMKIQHMGVYL